MVFENPAQFKRQYKFDVSGDPARLISTPRQRKGAKEHELSLDAYKSSLENVAIIAATDIDGIINYANDMFTKISGYRRHELIGNNHRILNSGLHTSEFFADLWRTIRSGQDWRGEICNRAKDGTLYWVDTTITPQRDDSGQIYGYMALRLDITTRKKAEALAIEAKALLNDIVDTSPNGVIAYDSDGNILLYNKVFEEIYNQFAPGVKIGRRRQDIIAFSNKKELLSPAGATTEEFNLGECCQTYLQRLPDGHWMQVQNRKSSTGTLVSVQTDVTELKRAEQKIALQVQRDSLTGILNRHALFERLSECSKLSNDPVEPRALVLIDLDDFKAVNDGMGHDAGDALLRHVAKSFQSAIRQSDVVARIGGDEFAILLHGAHTAADITRVMETLRTALTVPATIGQQTIIPAASMGVAIFPRDGITPEELMKSADLALYRCKQESRGAYRAYNMTMRRQRLRRALLTDKLREALARDEFSVVLQPQRDMSNGRHTGFEALARWKLGRRWIAPEELISIAEEAGLITQLSYQLIDKALAMMARLKSSGLEPGTLGINVVAAQLHEPDFVRRLMGLLHKHGTSPSEVEIEVTENVILDRSAESIARVLHKLHSKGLSIALDDFGMGYASLTHLKRFPLKRLKIDRSFISGVIEDKDDHVIVCAIISLAHSLGLQVVAEGIETPEQLEELFNLGCDAAQGYLVGRPLDELGTYDYLKPFYHPASLTRDMSADSIPMCRSPKPKGTSREAPIGEAKNG